jgi:reprolysin-like metallo-peptidase family M12B
VDSTDKTNFMANVILHEIGHALGLRHGVRVDQSSGYDDKDADGVTNSLLFPTAVVQPNSGTGNTTPCRLNFFGPVQRSAVRARYSIP